MRIYVCQTSDRQNRERYVTGDEGVSRERWGSDPNCIAPRQDYDSNHLSSDLFLHDVDSLPTVGQLKGWWRTMRRLPVETI